MGGLFISMCPTLSLVTQGTTKGQAKEALQDSIRLWFKHRAKWGTESFDLLGRFRNPAPEPGEEAFSVTLSTGTLEVKPAVTYGQALAAKDKLRDQLGRPDWLSLGVGVYLGGYRVSARLREEGWRARVPTEIDGVDVEVLVVGKVYAL